MPDLILDSLEIKNFRAFEHLRIEKLGRVNLIVGKNNVGKSSLLEALWQAGAENWRVEPELRRRSLIRQSEEGVSTVLIASPGLNWKQAGQLWKTVEDTAAMSDIRAALQLLVPETEQVHVVLDERPYFYIKTTSNPLALGVPLRNFGEGVSRMFGIALALVNAKNGMLLIDEADTGLHYSVLPDLWRLIFEVAHRLNVRVFATSHSWDCIQAFQYAADENTGTEGMLIRLESRTDGVCAVTFDEREMAVVTREQIEVR